MIHAPSREVRGHSPEELALRAWMNQGPRLLVRAFEKRLRCALASRFQIESRERSFVFFPALRALYPTGLVFAQIAVCLPSLGYQRTFRRLDSFSHEALGATPTPPPPPRNSRLQIGGPAPPTHPGPKGSGFTGKEVAFRPRLLPAAAPRQEKPPPGSCLLPLGLAPPKASSPTVHTSRVPALESGKHGRPVESPWTGPLPGWGSLLGARERPTPA